MYFSQRIAIELKTKCETIKVEALRIVLHQIGSIIVKALESKGSFKMNHIGKFYLVDVKERNGVNPRNGLPIKVAAKKVVKFKMAESLRKYFN